MPQIIQREKIEQSERTKEILRLGKEALDGAEEVRKRTRSSIAAAKQCGILLLEEQAHVAKALGKGSWESYFEITFSKTMGRSTAFGWMKLARTSNQLPTQRSPVRTVTGLVQELETQPESAAIESPNIIRRGMLALHLFPAKEHVPTTEAGADAPAPPPKPFSNVQLLAIVSRFTVWHAAFTQEYGAAATQEQCHQILRDLRPIVTFIDELRA